MNEWWEGFTTVQKIFWMVAIPFSLITIIQLVLEIIGLGHGGDTSIDHSTDIGDGGGAFFDQLQFFSVRNMIYFLMMFGWVGLATSTSGASTWVAVLAGIVAGVLTSLLIAWIFFTLAKLAEAGNTKITNAVGLTGNVYIPIPPNRSGTGQIQLVVQGATQEFDAVTDETDRMSTGTMVKVVEVLNQNLLLVSKQ